MTKKGGYQMVNLATLTYAQALAYVDCGKPLLIYDGVNKPYFADSIEVDSDENVVIRKGASSIVVAPDGTQTFNNVLNGALMENIVDENNNLRYKQFDDSQGEISGVTKTYSKCVLNGYSISCVLALTLANASTISDGQTLAKFELDNWILDKIFPVFSNIIEVRNIICYASDWTTQTLQVTFRKITNGVSIIANGNLTLTADRNARMQFDLIID